MGKGAFKAVPAIASPAGRVLAERAIALGLSISFTGHRHVQENPMSLRRDRSRAAVLIAFSLRPTRHISRPDGIAANATSPAM